MTDLSIIGQLGKDYGPSVAAVIIVYFVVKKFLEAMAQTTKQHQDAIRDMDLRHEATKERQDLRLQDMSRSFFDANQQTNTIISNHIDHSTEAIKNNSKQLARIGEINRNLEVAVNTLIGIQKQR